MIAVYLPSLPGLYRNTSLDTDIFLREPSLLLCQPSIGYMCGGIGDSFLG